jgi:uncharacterized membrane protein YqjE
MPIDGHGDRRGFGALLRDLADGSASLVRGEVRLARMELASAASGVARGTAYMAVGGVLAMLGLLCLLTALVLVLGDQWLPRDLYWLAALIVLVLLGGAAAFFAARGKRLLTPERLVPDQTAATLQEDKEWLKQRLTSGAISS